MKTFLISSLTVNIALLIIIFLGLRKIKLNKQSQFDNLPLSKGEDLFNNITKSKELFRLLKKEIHPDRFINNEELSKFAETKMMELGEIEHSYLSMISLINEMKINNFPFSEKFTNLYNHELN